MAAPSLRQQPAGPAGDDASPRLAFVEIQPSACVSDEWLSVGYDLTPRLERVSAGSALLDLGVCSEREAWEAAHTLLQQLAALGLEGRIGVGPSCVVAQLAVFATAASQPLSPITVITPENAPTFLRALPVALLPQLHPVGLIRAEEIERLGAYGLYTLGHLARLREQALVRQFGAVGRFLAAVAGGCDARPLCPTPQPMTLQFRLRLPMAAAAESVLPVLAPLAERVSRRLVRHEQRATLLRLILTWERGHVASGQVRLRVATNEARLLGEQLQRLGSALLAERSAAQGEGIAQVVLEVGELGAIVPAQTALWRTEAQKREALAQVAETLTRRAGGPQLFRPVCVAAAAIFRADRYRLRPLAPEATPPAVSPAVPDQRSSRLIRPDTPLMGAAPVTPWERVPQRLHWW